MYLGIDLGTSSVKVLLLDQRQGVLAVADAALDVSRPQPLWSEQDPQAWWAALDQAMQQLKAQVPAAMRQVRAIGLSGQMHGAVVLGQRRQVLRPAILWNDGRASAQCSALEAAVPRSRQITGNLAMPGFTAPKLLWLHQHEPEVFAQTRLVLLPKDWLRLKLTGEAVSDMSDASGTLWLDTGARCWSTEMLAACGLTGQHMPRLVEGTDVSGRLLQEVASAWGLPPDVPVAGGAGDNAATAVGVGAVRPGQGFVSLGTSGVIFLASDAFRPQPEAAVHAFAHALPQRWHQMSVMLSAASAFGWVTRLTQRASEAVLAQEAAQLSLSAREQAPLFLPYLSGERTPHNDAHASGTFIGLRPGHDAADLAYAVMEGVTFGLMDGLNAMQEKQPGKEALALVGGGARSDLWGQMIASGLRRSLTRDEGAQAAAALGAARLGWMADGGAQDEVCLAPQGGRPFEPDAQEASLLQQRYQQYRRLYPALQPWFGKQQLAA
ncbi:xylulokinase [Polaromonas sp.]|uniref:xylulokinase n=1 Tax=Polaromonas sp. TaxID=1869339 RepID=UPI002869EE48|nr:xylulokinase [Polaromonas sp.]